MSPKSNSDYKKAERIFVIGFLGSDRSGRAQQIAEETGYDVVDMDKYIEQKDGRSVKRICMTMGEHEYRNKEYEALSELNQKSGIVVFCGDGVVLDEMNMSILKENLVVVADGEKPVENLWKTAKTLENSTYAFMSASDEAVKHKKFLHLYESRKELYNSFM